MTSWCSLSSGTTGCHTRSPLVTPCRRTRGSPDPLRSIEAASLPCGTAQEDRLRLLGGLEDQSILGQAGDLEHPTHLRGGPIHGEPPSPLTCLAMGPHYHRDPGRIDELALVEGDQDLRDITRRPVQHSREPIGNGQVELTD